MSYANPTTRSQAPRAIGAAIGCAPNPIAIKNLGLQFLLISRPKPTQGTVKQVDPVDHPGLAGDGSLAGVRRRVGKIYPGFGIWEPNNNIPAGHSRRTRLDPGPVNLAANVAVLFEESRKNGTRGMTVRYGDK